MRWSPKYLILLCALLPAGLTHPSRGVEATKVTVLFGEADLPLPPTTTVQLSDLVPDPPANAPPPTAAPAPEPTIDYLAAVQYTRALPPETLIRMVFADTPDAERMVKIARRESGLRCDAKNRHSSATGLFQTLSGWRGLTEQRGLSWANVAGPDCLDDVLLARAIYDRSGLGPWRL